jgi:hypothetical protein
MPLTDDQKKALLSTARALIGTPYAELDCSHFVHQAYATAGLNYSYLNTKAFPTLVGKIFVEIPLTEAMAAGDVLMFAGHMGIWDPDGCQVLQDANQVNTQCQQFKNAVPFLSSMSGQNRGPDYGKMNWFGQLKAVYRWK